MVFKAQEVSCKNQIVPQKERYQHCMLKTCIAFPFTTTRIFFFFHAGKKKEAKQINFLFSRFTEINRCLPIVGNICLVL